MIPDPDIEMAVFEAARLMENQRQRDTFLNWVFRDLPQEGAAMRELLSAEKAAREWFQGASATRTRLAGEIMEAGLVALPQGAADDIESIGLPESIAGRFRIVQRLGGGSGGVVFLAEQSEPIRRQVAIKLLRAGMDTPAFVAAFDRERQALALMHHPNIASILDAGTTESGRPYFVMELVEGMRITTFCDEHQYTITRRLGLFVQVCSAIQHAHQKGIIHRDIKPANVLVTDNDGHDLPKVLDFGIALTVARDSSVAFSPLFAGTPAYMSPEQAETGNSDVDTRTDVFSLGVLLYELLAGDLPWCLEPVPPYGNLPSPSAHLAHMAPESLAELARRRQSRPDRLKAALRGDLDAIIRKATEHDRRQRYETVNSLIAEIQRHLSDFPVHSHPPGVRYFTRKFVRRNRLVVFSTVTVFLTLLLATGLAFNAYLKESEARHQAGLARANEADLRLQVQAREGLAKAALFLSENREKEAEEALKSISIPDIKPSTSATSVLRFLGERYAILGRWKQASECYVGLMKSNELVKIDRTVIGMDFLHTASCVLESGDEGTYYRLRLDMLERIATTGHLVLAERLVKSCLLRPAPPSLVQKLEPMAGLLRKTLENPNPKSESGHGWYALAVALFDYRNLDFEGTLVQTKIGLDSPDHRPSRIASLRMISSMAFHHLGQRDDAQSEFAAGTRLILDTNPQVVAKEASAYKPGTETWYAWAVARILMREAAATLGIQPPEAPPRIPRIPGKS